MPLLTLIKVSGYRLKIQSLLYILERLWNGVLLLPTLIIHHLQISETYINCIFINCFKMLHELENSDTGIDNHEFWSILNVCGDPCQAELSVIVIGIVSVINY